MKSEAEIRRHRDNLNHLMRQPCGCSGTQHEPVCKTGLLMMQATAKTLSWALGEYEEMQRLVDALEADSRDRINWPAGE